MVLNYNYKEPLKTNKSEVYDDQHAISPEQIHFTPVNPNDN